MANSAYNKLLKAAIRGEGVLSDYVSREDLEEALAKEEAKEFPHEDGDFSYICGSPYCRCAS